MYSLRAEMVKERKKQKIRMHTEKEDLKTVSSGNREKK
jgi:hypothetical protein